MKTTKGGKVMNPTDAYRKELRKKELKRNKKERKKVREVGILKKDPEAIREQIDKLEKMKADGALDKARKHKKRQLEDTLNLVLKKRKEYEDKMREKGETPVMFSHLGPPRRRTTAEEDERVRHPRPEDSVYYHPTLNPTGAPPPGKPPMYKSSIGPRISSLGSSSAGASSSMSETEEALAVPPPPPPPLPSADGMPAHDDAVLPSIPLPPSPPVPPKPTANLSASLPPPPPPGPPPKEAAGLPTLLPVPPPPPPQRPLQPPPPGTSVKEADKIVEPDKPILKDSNKVTTVLPPPPPPPTGLPPKSANQLSDVSSSEFVPNSAPSSNDNSTTMLVPPPPRQPPPMAHRIPLVNPMPPEMMPPGIAHFPLPDMRPPLVVPGISGRPPPPPPPGIAPPPMPRPMFAPGPPPFPRLPFQPGLPIPQEGEFDAFRPSAPQKPSYVKSAASTVVKKPLAQHNPELTAMIPASVRVRRETTAPKAKPKGQISVAPVSKPSVPSSTGKPDTATSSGPKPQSIDDSYMAFLEDMKALGALDG